MILWKVIKMLAKHQVIFLVGRERGAFGKFILKSVLIRQPVSQSIIREL